MRAEAFWIWGETYTLKEWFELAKNSFELVCAAGYSCPDNSGVAQIWERTYAANANLKGGKFNVLHYFKNLLN
jgi:hypothetical protein